MRLMTAKVSSRFSASMSSGKRWVDVVLGLLASRGCGQTVNQPQGRSSVPCRDGKHGQHHKPGLLPLLTIHQLPLDLNQGHEPKKPSIKWE